jgi:putative membrane protein
LEDIFMTEFCFSRWAGAALVLCLLAFAPAPLPAQTTNSSSQATPANTPESKFLKQAVRANDLEIGLAEIGVRKAQNVRLREFCTQLQKDHMLAAKEMAPLAQRYGVSIEPSQPRRNEKELARFDKLEGAQFDRSFSTDILHHHEDDIARYEQASRDLQAGDVKHFADSMVGHLRQHLGQAAEVAQAVGVSQSTIAAVLKHTNTAMGGTEEKEDHSAQGSGSSGTQK